MDEGIVADRLERLGPHGWFLLHGVQWPGRPKATLDHVLVGPGGVVVVDAKSWTGDVSVAAGVLWQGRFARTQSVEGALAQCAVVASLLTPSHRRFVRPLICITGQPDLFGITGSDVAVAGADRAVDAILALPSVLDPQAVAGLYTHLGRQLSLEPAVGNSAVKPLTVDSVAGESWTRSPGLPSRAVLPGVAKPAGRRSATVRPGRGLPPNGHFAHGGGRKSSAQPKAGGMTHLMFLAAFVVFALYTLPYWGR